MLLVPRIRSAPSPRWLVRTGDTVVGPVPTELLVRGVSEGKVPRGSWVRHERSLEWRRLEQVRELSSAAVSADSGPLSGCVRDLAAARDEGEVFLFLMHGAVAATGSGLGVLHRTRAASTPLVTSCVLGLSDERLGQIVTADDPLLRMARSGDCVHGDPADGFLQQMIAERLAPNAELAAVIMVPVFYGTELVAMLELGRADHGYRQGDVEALQRLSAFAVDRLEALSR
jgi:hypothetical protein